jgi:GTPase SAR1 family protein
MTQKVANKCDLVEERVVTREEGQSLADELGCSYFETSAKDHVNVDECFTELVREVRKHLPTKKDHVVLELTSSDSSSSLSLQSAASPEAKKKKTTKCMLL